VPVGFAFGHLRDGELGYAEILAVRADQRRRGMRPDVTVDRYEKPLPRGQ
jgi:hypothetical protein